MAMQERHTNIVPFSRRRVNDGLPSVGELSLMLRVRYEQAKADPNARLYSGRRTLEERASENIPVPQNPSKRFKKTMGRIPEKDCFS